MQILKGKVAVVTGASRSIGRGTALVLAEQGAIVYVTGRSVRGASTRPDLSGATIDDTAEMVTARGGIGIPIRCDHTRDSEVEAIFDRVGRDQGRLDILVNCTWGGNENTEKFEVPFWEQPLWRWDQMYSTGVRAHYVAARLAARIMLPKEKGLIINTTFWDRDKCLLPVPQDFGLTSISRLSYAMAHHLMKYNIAAISLSPGVPRNEGFISTEELLQEYQIPPVVSSQNWPNDSFLWKTESTQYTGRAVIALASDPKLMEKSGRVLTVGDLASEYGFTDIDGRQLPPYQIDWTPSSWNKQ